MVQKVDLIHFNLTLVRLEGLAANSGRFTAENWTVAELMHIVRNPAVLKKTVFYRNGEIVPGEEVLEAINRPKPH